MNAGSDENRQRYHGKRRNAFVGNIRYRPQRQIENDRTDNGSSKYYAVLLKIVLNLYFFQM